MISVPRVLRDYLAGKLALAAEIGTRLWAEESTPPEEENYRPAQGPAICFKVRGGGPDTEESALLDVSVQFKIYGKDRETAWKIYRLLYDALHDQGGGQLRWAQSEILGASLEEPDSGWKFVLTFFRVWVVDEWE